MSGREPSPAASQGVHYQGAGIGSRAGTLRLEAGATGASSSLWEVPAPVFWRVHFSDVSASAESFVSCVLGRSQTSATFVCSVASPFL